jgi:tRNA 2-thiouridine synthesizing protein B
MLHTVNKSPFERTALDSCLKTAVKGSAILLYEDGVYAARKGTVLSARMEVAAKDFAIYVLEPDLKARGIGREQVIDGVTVVDYGGFVDLVAEKGTVNAWL